MRFIWFSAEESGLIGSQYYVDQLSDAELGQIAAMLNFDMVASPNFARFVYDGSSKTAPKGSGAIENVFNDYFKSRGLAYEATPFDGRSDYGPFIAEGIPAGGLFTGAEGIKTAAQVTLYGGIAGVAFDPCYHEACDTLANINHTALDQMSDAAAAATMRLAQTHDVDQRRARQRQLHGHDRTRDAGRTAGRSVVRTAFGAGGGAALAPPLRRSSGHYSSSRRSMRRSAPPIRSAKRSAVAARPLERALALGAVDAGTQRVAELVLRHARRAAAIEQRQQHVLARQPQVAGGAVDRGEQRQLGLADALRPVARPRTGRRSASGRSSRRRARRTPRRAASRSSRRPAARRSATAAGRGGCRWWRGRPAAGASARA